MIRGVGGGCRRCSASGTSALFLSFFSPKQSPGFGSARKTPMTPPSGVGAVCHPAPFNISLSDIVQPSGCLWMLLLHNHRRGNESLASLLHLPIFHFAFQPQCPQACEEFKENVFVNGPLQGEEASLSTPAPVSPGCSTCIMSTSVLQ